MQIKTNENPNTFRNLKYNSMPKFPASPISLGVVFHVLNLPPILIYLYKSFKKLFNVF